MSARGGDVRRAGGVNGRRNGRPAALRVRLARQSDLVPLNFFFDAVLRRDYFLRRGQLEQIVRGPHHQLYVAEIHSVLVGVAITTRGSRLVNAVVHPAYRGLGIGRELLKCSGVTEVRAKLDMSTGDPRGFYRSLGFVSTGARNGKGNIAILRLPDTAKRRTPQQCARRFQRTNGKRGRNACVLGRKAKSRK